MLKIPKISKDSIRAKSATMFWYYSLPFSQSSTDFTQQGGYMMQWLNDNHPEFLGKENPNNAIIEKLFGDQGGYY